MDRFPVFWRNREQDLRYIQAAEFSLSQMFQTSGIKLLQRSFMRNLKQAEVCRRAH